MTLEWTVAYVERDYVCQGSEYDWGIDSLGFEAGRTDIMEIPPATKMWNDKGLLPQFCIFIVGTSNAFTQKTKCCKSWLGSYAVSQESSFIQICSLTTT